VEGRIYFCEKFYVSRPKVVTTLVVGCLGNW